MIKKLILPAVFLLVISTGLSAATEAADFSDLSDSIPEVYIFREEFPEISRLPGTAADLAPQLEHSTFSGFKPWTNQIRLESFAESDFGLVLAVNSGYPLILGADGKIVSIDREAAETFIARLGDRTIGTVYTDGSSVNFHVYRDNLFNPSGETGGDSQAVILSLEKENDGNYLVNSPQFSFASENPGWEPVELIHRDSRNFVAWKYTDDKKTRFRYIVHGTDGSSLDEIDESYFRDEYNMTDADSGPFSVRGFVRAVREGVVDEGFVDAGDIFIRLTVAESGKASPAYYSNAPAERFFGGNPKLPVEFTACLDGETCYVLHDNDLFVCAADIRRYSLPELPEDFEYTVLSVSGARLLLGWEEKRFPFTGRSGMMLVKMRDILN